MIGQKFGSLTVIEKVKAKDGKCWKCLCDCGNIYFAKAYILKRENRPRSCGCSRKKIGETWFLSNFDEGN